MRHAARPEHSPRAATAWAACLRCAGPAIFFRRPASKTRFLSRASASIFFKLAVLALQLLELTRLVEVQLTELPLPTVEAQPRRCGVPGRLPGCSCPGRLRAGGGSCLRPCIACLSWVWVLSQVPQTNSLPGSKKRSHATGLEARHMPSLLGCRIPGRRRRLLVEPHSHPGETPIVPRIIRDRGEGRQIGGFDL